MNPGPAARGGAEHGAADRGPADGGSADRRPGETPAAPPSAAHSGASPATAPLDSAAIDAAASEAADAAASTPVRFVHGFATDRGLRRELNEDSLLAAETLFAVADGMGGHEAGEVASRVCVETLAAGYRAAEGRLAPEDIHRLMGQADLAIREAASERAGTTLAGAAVVEHEGRPHWLVFNVGDSRTYRYSHGRLAQVSVDHSEVQMLVDSGEISLEQAIVHPRRNVITRALGAGDDPRPEFWMMPVEIGDRLLICSDGLSGEVRDGDIQSSLERFPSAQDAVDELVQAALRNGGRDNVSVIVVDAVAGHPDDSHVDTRPRRQTEADSTTTEPGVSLFGAGQPTAGGTPAERGARQSPHRTTDDRGSA
ncbi:hypothetical protein GCM10022377_13220 [Zhihengliuella alba]|uniref:PPM-type phosphatase domain-containing protein n=1 Tax=Zhihengliuella alba TaxID=547018 RepID=A0ABP7D5Q3_9MICC